VNLLLTDRLACPRCGPQFGLILLAKDLQERRVLQGDLGCANCRQRYSVIDGFADLRAVGHPPELPEREALTAVEAPGEQAVRIAALVGVTEGPAQVLLLGALGRFASALTQIVAGVDWIVGHPGASDWPETDGVDRICVYGALPFYDRVLRAVVFAELDSIPLEEACRVVQPGGRVVCLDAPSDRRGELEALGFEVVFADGQVLVGARR